MSEEMIKVLVVDDSLVFRNLLATYINQAPGMKVVAVANDPFEARDAIIKYNPDVMTLDVELPRMDGIEFLRKLMPQYPVRTIVISALSDRVFDALSVGAVDFVAKPAVSKREQLNAFVRNELPEKIRIASRAKLNQYGKRPVSTRFPIEKPSGKVRQMPDYKENTGDGYKDIIVAIGASTGGTEATTALIEAFGPNIPPVLVTQHMPEGFTKMYADRLNTRSNVQVAVSEAVNGEAVLPGHVYIAPGGDRHMELVRKNGTYRIALKEGEKVNGHKPSVEVLFHSVAREAKDKAVGIILTGMGGDGAKGLLAMRQAGARTIGQDESTCVVYGMPKVAFEMGAVEAQERLPDIVPKMYQFIEQINRKYK